LPAISNDAWVRVEGSKNRLIWVLPLSVGKTFRGCREIGIIASARARRSMMSCWFSWLMPSRLRCGKGGLFTGWPLSLPVPAGRTDWAITLRPELLGRVYLRHRPAARA
jgi:hypothetical protein